MSLARNAHAKYGAKIPTARSTGAKQAQAEEQAAPASPPAKPAREAKKGDKKR